MKRVWSTAIPLALAVAGAAALWLRTAPVERTVVENPLPTYSPFTVKTSSGALSLLDLRGQAVVVYFGYTTCPDICPTTLATMKAAWKQLSDDERKQATLLFVSVDPERDTPERLQQYVGYFDKTFHAGTASIDTSPSRVLSNQSSSRTWRRPVFSIRGDVPAGTNVSTAGYRCARRRRLGRSR